MENELEFKKIQWWELQQRPFPLCFELLLTCWPDIELSRGLGARSWDTVPEGALRSRENSPLLLLEYWMSEGENVHSSLKYTPAPPYSLQAESSTTTVSTRYWPQDDKQRLSVDLEEMSTTTWMCSRTPTPPHSATVTCSNKGNTVLSQDVKVLSQDIC